MDGWVDGVYLGGWTGRWMGGNTDGRRSCITSKSLSFWSSLTHSSGASHLNAVFGVCSLRGGQAL